MIEKQRTFYWKKEAALIIRYSGSGVMNTIIGVSSIFVAMSLGASPIISNVAGYTLGFIFAFFLSKKFVFRSHGHFVAEGFRCSMWSSGAARTGKAPFLSRIASDTFWKLYKKFVIREIPEKGVDVFGCNKIFCDRLLQLGESNSSLIWLVSWLGFCRAEVMYERRERQHGKSAWTLKKKLNYLFDIMFSFTDLPIKLLTLFGLLGLTAAVLLGIIVMLANMFGTIVVPGYTATVLTVILFGGLNSLWLGIVGTYAWRTFENTKGRPLSVLMAARRFGPDIAQEENHG